MGLSIMLSKRRVKSGGGYVDKVVTNKKFGSTKPKSGGSKRRPRSKANETNLETLFSSDIIGDSQTNSSLPSIPGFTRGDKEKALTELVASIPAAGRDEGIPDKQAVLEATRKFTGRVRSDKRGGWRLSGLKTSLFHHQVSFLHMPEKKKLIVVQLLGAAFMVYINSAQPARFKLTL